MDVFPKNVTEPVKAADSIQVYIMLPFILVMSMTVLCSFSPLCT